MSSVCGCASFPIKTTLTESSQDETVLHWQPVCLQHSPPPQVEPTFYLLHFFAESTLEQGWVLMTPKGSPFSYWGKNKIKWKCTLIGRKHLLCNFSWAYTVQNASAASGTSHQATDWVNPLQLQREASSVKENQETEEDAQNLGSTLWGLGSSRESGTLRSHEPHLSYP